ncbi:hypothetical protein Cgig2_004654 [Carnegiea gigantea]|uniref:Uncharacterized protein n=1 Tax=Carnegiea gigantea TaxID=171969 RepID=A0A9Q1JZW4_9CARY|nr:hypothetical protein Cgig2_004654 [Carnegiea gigantea]
MPPCVTDILEPKLTSGVLHRTDLMKEISMKCFFVYAEEILHKMKTFKYPYEQFTLRREEHCDTQISAGVTLQPETFSSAQTPYKLSTNWEASTAACTPPDKVLSPHQMEVEMGLSSLDHMKISQISKERLHGLRFSREECMDIDMICEADVELLNLLNDYQSQNADEGDGDALEQALAEKLDHVLPEEKEVPHVLLEDKEMPSVAEKTPDSEVLDARGARPQELLVVPTPAKKENIQRPCKRKCIIDVSTVLDNQ